MTIRIFSYNALYLEWIWYKHFSDWGVTICITEFTGVKTYCLKMWGFLLAFNNVL